MCKPKMIRRFISHDDEQWLNSKMNKPGRHWQVNPSRCVRQEAPFIQVSAEHGSSWISQLNPENPEVMH